MKNTLFFAAFLAFFYSMAEAAWQRAAGSADRALEVAIASIEGTQIESSNNIGRVSALLAGRVTEVATLPAGASDAVINLGRQAVIERVAFHNLGGEGRVAVSVSADNTNWVSLGQTVFSPADSQVVVPFAPAQGKFVKVAFEMSRSAEMRHFEVFGGLVSGSLDKIRGKVVNMATAVSGARIVYVNPTPIKGSDDSVRYGSFSFPESDEKYRTVIYDLGRPKVLTEFGSVHSPRPVRFEVFAFTELPEKEDWRGRRSFDPGVFEQTQPVAHVEDREGKGYVKCRPAESITAQYVALRWEPDFNPPAFIVSGVEFIGPAQLIGEDGGKGVVDVAPKDRGEVIANTFSNYGFTGPFSPNSLMGAGSAGLPFPGGGGQNPPGRPVIVGGGRPPVIPPVSPGK